MKFNAEAKEKQAKDFSPVKTLGYKNNKIYDEQNKALKV